MVKNGKCPRGAQRYKCGDCSKSTKDNYNYRAYSNNINNDLTVFVKEGLGIRSISRILGISKTTVAKRILLISSLVRKPVVKMGEVYELDELCTYIGNKKKRIWVAYAISRKTRAVVDFRAGTRSNKHLRPLVDTLILANAKRIHTDKLINYRSLIPKELHKVKQFGINHIERMNLTLRTHLKRLNRRTICFSRSIRMLSACITIYFWGQK